jgi:hypothetical protein
MPQINKQHITVGSRGVGSVWVDGGAVRGEGGPLHPQLVVPLTIEMASTPAEAMVATIWVRGSLLTQAMPRSLVTHPMTEMLMEGFPARSLPHGATDHTVQLRFFLTPSELEALERHRHAASSDPFTLYLAVEAVVAGLRTHNQINPGQPAEASAWDHSFGLVSEVLPFWNTRIDPVWVGIEQSTWIRDVLPGLGYDRSRLIEIDFPPPLPDHPSAAAEWDKARRAFDERRYGDCVSECRDVLSMWNRQLGASKTRPLATVIAEKRGWPADDSRRTFLEAVWKAAIDVVNVPHHPEGRPASQHFDAADARLMLLMTAALSGYVNG